MLRRRRGASPRGSPRHAGPARCARRRSTSGGLYAGPEAARCEVGHTALIPHRLRGGWTRVKRAAGWGCVSMESKPHPGAKPRRPSPCRGGIRKSASHTLSLTDPEFQTAKLRHPYFLSGAGYAVVSFPFIPAQAGIQTGSPLARGRTESFPAPLKSRARGTPGTAPRLHEAGPTDLDASQHRGMLKSE